MFARSLAFVVLSALAVALPSSRAAAAPTGDSTAVGAAADSSAPGAAAIVLPDGTLRDLRARVGGRRVRILFSGYLYELRRPRFLPEGVAFASCERSGREPRSAASDSRLGAPVSPVPWSQVRAIQARHGRKLLGAAIAAVTVIVAISCMAASPDMSYDYDLGEGGAFFAGVFLVPPAAAVGAMVGALTPSWQRVY